MLFSCWWETTEKQKLRSKVTKCNSEENVRLKRCNNNKKKNASFFVSARTYVCVRLYVYNQGVYSCCAPVFIYRPYFSVDVNAFVCTAVTRTSQWTLCCLAGSSRPTPLSSSKLRLRLYAKFSGLTVTSCDASEGLWGWGWINTLLPCSLHAPDSSCSSWFSTWRCSRTYRTNTAMFKWIPQQECILFIEQDYLCETFVLDS